MKRKFYILKHSRNVFIAVFDKRDDMGLHFVRMQEFYESETSLFRGNYFTLPEYSKWWSKAHGRGIFNYPRVWRGYNLSGKSIVQWEILFRKHEPVLRDEEEELLSALRKNAGDDINDIYLIGITRCDFINESSVLLHELSHAFFYIDPVYRSVAMKDLGSVPVSERLKMERKLKDEGYHQDVLADEIVAKNAETIGSKFHVHLTESINRNEPTCGISIAGRT